MAYRNKVYVAFDGDTDISYYNLMKAWKENSKIAFDFNDAHDINTALDRSTEETIKKRLRERLKNSKVFVLLVGKSTKYLYKFVRWEIEQALDLQLPIIVVNLNNTREKDAERCPRIVYDELAVHIPFGQKIMNYALNHWPNSHSTHKSKGESGSYRYRDSVYKTLGS